MSAILAEQTRRKTERERNLEAARVRRTSWEKTARPSQLPPDGDWLFWLVLAGRGFGKALDVTTPIPTPSGWSTMGSIRAGDVVFDESGAQCRVLAAHPVQIGRPCFRVRFSDGSEIVADEDHLWTTINRKTRKAIRRRTGIPSAKPQCQPRHFAQTLTTREIAATLYDGREVNHAIPCAGALQCADVELPIDPYLLGLWLGDGHSAGAAITTADEEIVSAFVESGYFLRAAPHSNSGLATTYSIATHVNGKIDRSKSLKVKLQKLGVINNKHIPSAYLRGSASQRLALMQGLFDTDGYCDSKTGSSEFCSVSHVLAIGLRELALSLGFKAVVYNGRATINGRDCGPKYRVCFTAHREMPIFRLPRKIAAQPPKGAQAERASRRYIVAVDPVPSVPVRCITVDSPSRLYLAGEAMIATHNTRLSMEDAAWYGAQHSNERIALVAATYADARDTMVEGQSGLLSCLAPSMISAWNRSLGELLLANGTRYKLFAATEPNRLRGPQHHRAYCDELAAWEYPETWDQLLFGLRLGTNPRVVIATTPRPTPLMRRLIEDAGTVITRGSTYENADNIAATVLAKLKEKYEGTRLGRQELNAELIDEVQGALWTRGMIDESRKPIRLPDMDRIVVAIDPSGARGVDDESADSIGIVVAGKGVDGRGYILADRSCKMSPAGWGQRAVAAYHEFKADRIIAERNYGGAMVEHVVKTTDPNVAYTEVVASRGKVVRAEPIAALYEQKRISHVAAEDMTALEDQMCEMASSGYLGEGSPDRLDAAVWALTELMLGDEFDVATWMRAHG